jgi:hypothetical protein
MKLLMNFVFHLKSIFSDLVLTPKDRHRVYYFFHQNTDFD